MSTRIIRAPVRPQQGVTGTQEAPKGTGPSPASQQTRPTTGQTTLQGRFEAHTGHDPLLNQGQTKQVQSPRLHRTLTGSTSSAEAQSGDVRQQVKGGGRTRGKRALALLGGSQIMKVDAKAKAKAKAKAEAKSKSSTKAKADVTSENKSSKVKASKAEAKAKASRTLETGSSQGTKTSKKATAQSGQDAKTQTATSGTSTTTSTTTGKSTAQPGAGTQPTAQATTGTSTHALQTGTSGTSGTPGTSSASTPAGAPLSQGVAQAQATGESGSTAQAGATASAATGAEKAEVAQTAKGGLTSASAGREAGATQGKTLAQGAERGAATQTGATQTGATQTGTTSDSKQPMSLKSLLFQEVKETGGTARAEGREDKTNTPRQQFRQLVKQWTNAAEASVLHSVQAAMPNDVAAIAWKLASLAQQGVLPQGELMSLITKMLKKPGNKKRIDRIKTLLVKKGVVAAGVSADTLALIAAMVALYLGKQGNIDADDLIEELFGMPSRGIDLVLPDGGGSFHEEGREQQAHEDHSAGRKLPETDPE